MDVKLFPETNFLKFGNKWKSEGAKSGKYGYGRANLTTKSCSFSNANASELASSLFWCVKDSFFLLQARSLLANFNIQLIRNDWSNIRMYLFCIFQGNQLTESFSHPKKR
ncbi:hypothetical protein TNCV_2885471 [Trichonephila clavipes]|nr:hypothetical protein TNCV_2885471 [Trichonephila clavipes]